MTMADVSAHRSISVEVRCVESAYGRLTPAIGDEQRRTALAAITWCPRRHAVRELCVPLRAG